MLITNATVVTCERPNRVLYDHAVYVGGRHVQEIGPSAKLERAHPKSRRLDARGQFLMPGQICAHVQFHRRFGRGLIGGTPPPNDSSQLMERLWHPLDRALLEEDIRYSALAGLVDAIRAGTTTVFDHHASENAVDGSLDIIAEAIERSGIRGVLCYAVSDHGGADVADAGIKENLRFLKRIQAEDSTRVAGMFGLQASRTLSGGTLQACRAAVSSDTGFHVIAAEQQRDQVESQDRTGMRVIDRFHNHGVLGPRTIAADCVKVDALEISLLQQTGTWVSHQPGTNARDAVGPAPVESMLRAGVNVCLGGDGSSPEMWDQWRAAQILHRVCGGSMRAMDGKAVAQLAWHNNAALARTYFPEAAIGRIEPGAVADLILVDYNAPSPVDEANVEDHVLEGIRVGRVTATMADGKLLMKDRVLMTLDEAEIGSRCRELAARVWKRMETGAAA